MEEERTTTPTPSTAVIDPLAKVIVGRSLEYLIDENNLNMSDMWFEAL